jgi:carboxymethylenebutenolidase
MSLTTRYESVAVDGDHFDAYCAIPEGGEGPGVLLFQEIFGINDNIRSLAERLAGAGYVALAPDMFWRVERRFERKDESGMADAFAMVQKFDFPKSVGDIRAAHAHLLAMPECTGKVGAIGFCLGGGLAFAAATMSRVDGRSPDAAVCYYGSAINDMLSEVESLHCPAMFHYGANDPFISTENIAAVEQAVTGLPDTQFHRYEAGHAFSNWDAPSMYNQDAADLAWSRTLEFFSDHLA